MKYKVSLNGKDYLVEVEKGDAIMLDVTQAQAAPLPAATPAAPAVAPAMAAAAPLAGSYIMEAPMPGNVISVKVQSGTQVKTGDVMLILEAMKMENEIRAPKDGTVAQVLVAAGTTVNTGDALISLQ